MPHSHCKASLPHRADRADDYSDEDELDTIIDRIEARQDHMAEHFVCEELAPAKNKISQAIDDGAVMNCPTCDLGGRKDGSCTHMSCVKCQMTWCYCCGLSVDECDKAERTGAAAAEPLYGHNQDWQTNPQRCPMYLTSIAEVDEDWPSQSSVDQQLSPAEQASEPRCVGKCAVYHPSNKKPVFLFWLHRVRLWRPSASTVSTARGP